MKRFIKHYALEIYTLISLLLLLVGALTDDLSIVQKFVMVYVLLFILHEWEEMYYPGGFVALISGMIGKNVSDEQKRASRIAAGILLLSLTIVPFCWDSCVIAILVTAAFGIFEGFVHLMAIRLFHLKKFYSPGLVTAIMELLTSVALIVYIEQNNMAAAIDYFAGVGIMILCFVTMQKSLTMMIGFKYSDMPKMVRRQWAKKQK